MSSQPVALDLALVDRVERAALTGWPATFVEEFGDGWVLRATPGLDRGRSNHTLAPRRPLHDGELEAALARVLAFSRGHGIRGGLQLSPLELHGPLVDALVAAGWEPAWGALVMTAEREAVLAAAGDGELAEAGELVVSRVPDEAWLRTWAACEPEIGADAIAASVATVFAHMGERGRFMRLGDSATGIAVAEPAGEYSGLFSLAVRPELRGRGLGRRLVLSMLAALETPRVYLQVLPDNAVALRLYARLGFRTLHSYRHVLAPLEPEGA